MKALFSIIFICGMFPAVAQKSFETREQTWLGYFNQTRFSKRSGIWIDLHHRRTGSFIEDGALNIARLGYTYYLTDQVRVTAGYAYAYRYPIEGNPGLGEHRPWQQIQWFDKKAHFNLMQWFRVEERYQPTVSGGEETGSYAFNWRFRYNFALTFPLKGHVVQAKTPFLFFNNEVHVNAGKRIVNNYFDQNRLFLGFGYQFSSHVNAHLGYMYVFQQRPAGNEYLNIHAIRLFLFHNIDLRRKEG